ncbi:carbonic anhydrase [Virgisporangium aliadipatigenens]|uniref:carbonic anhydrase n=1 Tax=Virgisporangium aliadipatigenens TaxID=741659 RepID=A0A8J3YVB8_9ACTN|nr:carbonic anhydrase [Virgisporangium aliadipatigenens]GIJ50520.1 carbonic anhydrase [Virgisporangium aliadipatigenens]
MSGIDKVGRRALLGGLAATAGMATLTGRALAQDPGAVTREPALVPVAVSTPTEPTPPDPGRALARLLAGNQRFVSGHLRHPHQTAADLHEVAAGQHPFAIVLGCADSRVPPEVLFDQGLGDLFDNRVAGNIADDLLLGSIEFAVEEFGPRLILVLGHERCGAVSATFAALDSGQPAPGHIGTIVTALRPVLEPLRTAPDRVEAGVRASVRATVTALTADSEILAERVHSGELGIVGARYDLDTGRVTILP